jgi:demethylmenaquinone methyltransferase/2-methoxy-6-polyprenyl-1,4-benzoquinol methylase
MKPKDARQQEEYVRSLFAFLANRYDFVSSALSLTRTKHWRRFAAAKSGLKPGGHALDVGCGTGLFTFELARIVGSTGRVVGLDSCPEMLARAREKCARTPFREAVEFLEGTAVELPFPDGSFDCAATAFTLHTVPDLEKTLSEMIRVVRPGGRVVNLELARPRIPGLKQVYSFYLGRVMPFAGRVLRRLRVGPPGFLEYFARALQELPDQQEMQGLFSRLGLVDVRCYELDGGIAAVQVGVKVESGARGRDQHCGACNGAGVQGSKTI